MHTTQTFSCWPVGSGQGKGLLWTSLFLDVFGHSARSASSSEKTSSISGRLFLRISIHLSANCPYLIAWCLGHWPAALSTKESLPISMFFSTNSRICCPLCLDFPVISSSRRMPKEYTSELNDTCTKQSKEFGILRLKLRAIQLSHSTYNTCVVWSLTSKHPWWIIWMHLTSCQIIRIHVYESSC